GIVDAFGNGSLVQWLTGTHEGTPQGIAVALLWLMLVTLAGSDIMKRLERGTLKRLRRVLRDEIQNFGAKLVLGDAGACEMEGMAPVPHGGRSIAELVRYASEGTHPASKRAYAARLAVPQAPPEDVLSLDTELRAALRDEDLSPEDRGDLTALAAISGNSE